MKTILSSSGYDLTPNGRDRLEESLVCPGCGSDQGLDGQQVNHRCCYCRDGGRIRTGPGDYVPCPRCPTVAVDQSPRLRIPTLFRGVSFSQWLPDNGAPRLRCQGYVNTWPPAKPFLFLTGVKGSGKTTLAVAVLKAVSERHGVVGQFWPVTDLLARLRATADSERATESEDDVLTQMRRIPLLVLDDWGAHKATDFAEDRLFTIIDYRYREMRPTIITSNTDLVDLDSRVKSRLSDAQVCNPVQFTGPDMRPGAGR